MSTTTRKPTRPSGLAASGRRIWTTVTDMYALRADELRVLEDACREADLVDQLTKAMDGESLLSKGSQGQPVINPLVPEIRQHRSTLAALMRQLKLPEDGDEEKAAGERSSAARSAANARWARRGA